VQGFPAPDWAGRPAPTTNMTKIKICGITNLNDALAAIEAGADLLGFNFYPKSPRYIDIGLCRGITSKLRYRSAHVVFVGVFVNASVAEIHATLETCGLELAQLHGDEPPAMLDALQGRAFKAIRLAPQTSFATSVDPFCRRPSVPASASPLQKSARVSASHPVLLIDAAVKGVYGGSGVVADWSAAAELAKRTPLLLAGGLTLENVAAAVQQVQPWGVDVASGVESSPGVKDVEKMRRFVAAARKIQ
jgi:phosphoribosylanthranilate isomerase